MGKFPSGKNEIDALKSVIMKVNESNDDDAVVVVVVVVDGEEEAKVDKRSVGLCNFIPAFMIYGPYAVARYEAELCELVTIDTAAIDRKATNSKKRAKEDKHETIVSVSKISDLDERRLGVEDVQTEIQVKHQRMLDIQQGYDMAKEMFNMSQPGQQKDYFFSVMFKCLQEREASINIYFTFFIYFTPTNSTII